MYLILRRFLRVKKKIISAFIMSLILISNINVKVFADDVISRFHNYEKSG